VLELRLSRGGSSFVLEFSTADPSPAAADLAGGADAAFGSPFKVSPQQLRCSKELTASSGTSRSFHSFSTGSVLGSSAVSTLCLLGGLAGLSAGLLVVCKALWASK